MAHVLNVDPSLLTNMTLHDGIINLKRALLNRTRKGRTIHVCLYFILIITHTRRLQKEEK